MLSKYIRIVVIFFVINLIMASGIFVSSKENKHNNQDLENDKKMGIVSKEVSLQTCPPHPLKNTGFPTNNIPSTSFPTQNIPKSSTRTGTFNLLCIRVQFQTDNVTQTTGDGTMDPSHNVNYYNSIFSNMKSYYQEVSYGQFNLNASVTDKVYTLDHEMGYYGQNSNSVERNVFLVNDSIAKADPDVNFSLYDYFIVIHAGSGEETDINDDSPWDIWSNHIGIYHLWQVLGQVIITDDGKWINEISIIPETQDQDGYWGSDITGVACHEFGHDLGWPDLYDVGYNSDGIGIWGLMGGGAHLNEGKTPSHPSAWSKVFMNWVDPIEITQNTQNIIIRNVESYPDIYKITVPNTNGNEYFLIENRQKTGYDRYIPHGGLLIWHIDESVIYQNIGGGFTRLEANSVNVNPNHKGVDLEEASSTQELDNPNDYNSGDSNDPWYSNQAGFTPYSNPNSNSYSNQNTEIFITEITGSSQNMMFSVRLEEREVAIIKPEVNSSWVQPGETGSFEFQLTSNREETGPVNDWLTLSASGDNADWVQFNANPAPLAGKNIPCTFYANITVPADALYTWKAIITIDALSNDTTQAIETITLTVNVGKTTGYEISKVGNISLGPGEANKYNLTFSINNTGNELESFEISTLLSNEWWHEYLVYDEVDIPPLSSRPLYLHFHSLENSLAGELCEITLVVKLGDKEKTSSFTATVEQVYNITIAPEILKINATHNSPATYNIELENHGNGIDNVSLELNGKKANWEITLSQKYLLIPPGESVTIQLIVRPPNLAQKGEDFRFTLSGVSGGGISVETDAMEVTVEKYLAMSIALDGYNTTLRTDQERASFNVEMFNRGNVENYYTISIITPDSILLELEGYIMDNITIQPFERLYIDIFLVFPDERIGGIYSLELSITMNRNPSIHFITTLNVSIPMVYEVDMSITPSMGELDISASTTITYALVVNNTSNTNITIAVISPESVPGLNIFISPDGEYIKLARGESVTFEIKFSIRRGVETGNSILDFTIRTFDDNSEHSVKTYLNLIRSGGGPGEESESAKEYQFQFLLSIGGGILVCIIIVAVIITLKTRRRKRNGLEMGEGNLDTMEEGSQVIDDGGETPSIHTSVKEEETDEIVSMDILNLEKENLLDSSKITPQQNELPASDEHTPHQKPLK